MNARRYFYVVEYTLNGAKVHVENPYLYANESDAYEYLGKCISDLVRSNPGVAITVAKVSYKYEEV